MIPSRTNDPRKVIKISTSVVNVNTTELHISFHYRNDCISTYGTIKWKTNKYHTVETLQKYKKNTTLSEHFKNIKKNTTLSEHFKNQKNTTLSEHFTNKKKMAKRDKIVTLNTHMHDHSVSFLEKAPQLKNVAGLIWLYRPKPPLLVKWCGRTKRSTVFMKRVILKMHWQHTGFCLTWVFYLCFLLYRFFIWTVSLLEEFS